MVRKRKLGASASCGAQDANCAENAIDRFSNLPEEVAHRILSFLSFKDLTRVGAVSKRCRQFHLSAPVVSFDYSSCKPRGVTNQKIVKLMSSLDRYLCYRGDHRMQFFSINWSCFGSEPASKFSDDHFRVITWIVNAVRCNVEVLDLRLACDFLALPSCVFLSESLRSLSVHLTWRILEAPSVSFSSNLCYLKLEKVTIVDERFFKWISRSCKFMKELQLIWIWIRGMQTISIESSSLESLLVWINDPNLIHLNISGQKLESIDISLKDYYAPPSSIEVNSFAPNLKYLKWEGILNNSLNLGKLTGLEKVEIFLASQRNKFDKVFEKFDKVFEFLHSVRWAKVLIINEETMKRVSERDSTGGWFKGFVTNLGCGKILEAELWGVFRGLLLTWNEGIRRIQVECDSLTAVSLINGEIGPNHPFSSLIHSCKDMLLRDWECSISHIYREQNIVADHLAHMGQCSNLGYQVVDLPPHSIVSLLANDSIRMTTARLVPV